MCALISQEVCLRESIIYKHGCHITLSAFPLPVSWICIAVSNSPSPLAFRSGDENSQRLLMLKYIMLNVT